ncbi:MAG: hypothetical protein MK033_04985 [Candidatus Caenarcaniphilales bacterium]|nr:hypothetical protein [Candidatus Caenarcaniphilales bacterium]
MSNEVDITIIGGEQDFNLIRLATYVSNNTELKLNLILFGENENHSFHYDLINKQLIFNDKELKSTSAYIRKDIFRQSATGKSNDEQVSQNWYEAFCAWICGDESIRVLNKKLLGNFKLNKSRSLFLAEKLGLNIPETYISNSTKYVNQVLDQKGLIYKPLGGGKHTKELKDKFDPKTYQTEIFVDPYFFQERLEYPELRIFYINGELISYQIYSSELDYRDNRHLAKIEEIETPSDIASKLQKLNLELDLDYSASDLKFCPKLKTYKFLEINSNPMFNSFDKVSKHKISKAMIKTLVG